MVQWYHTGMVTYYVYVHVHQQKINNKTMTNQAGPRTLPKGNSMSTYSHPATLYCANTQYKLCTNYSWQNNNVHSIQNKTLLKTALQHLSGQ